MIEMIDIISQRGIKEDYLTDWKVSNPFYSCQEADKSQSGADGTINQIVLLSNVEL